MIPILTNIVRAMNPRQSSREQLIEDVKIGGARNDAAGFQQVCGYLWSQATPDRGLDKRSQSRSKEAFKP